MVERSVAFILALLLALLFTPLVIRLARVAGVMDQPDERKVHRIATPRMGGVAIVMSSLITLILVWQIFPDVFTDVFDHSRSLILISSSLLMVFLIGLRDDFKPLGPGLKFSIQFLAASLIYFAGFSISQVTNPWSDGMFSVVVIEFPLTLLWIVGITNAFNLIDGLDGLATGVATIALVSVLVLSVYAGDAITALFSAILIGSFLGFLRYNFHPAKVFLGDSGSLFIGFSLALISIHSTAKIPTGLTVLFPLMVLILPITDTVVSMMRRFLGSFLVERNSEPAGRSMFERIYGMFKPDRRHIHHQLMVLGFSHRNTVLVLYSVSAIFALGAILFVQAEGPEQSMAILLGLALFLYMGIRQLRYREIAIVNNGLMIPFAEKWVVNRTLVLTLLDLIFIVVSAAVAFRFVHISGFTEGVSEIGRFHLFSLVVVQAALFQVTGIYREELRQLGLGQILSIMSAVIYTVLGSSLLFLLTGALPLEGWLPFLLVDFYLLLTFCLGVRMIYQILTFRFDRQRTDGNRVLVYGADRSFVHLLERAAAFEGTEYRMVGFLDDSPELKGKRIEGYRVLGTHWELRKILQHHRICCIFVCNDQGPPENIRRLKAVAKEFGIDVKRMTLQLDDVAPQETPATGRKVIGRQAVPTT